MTDKNITPVSFVFDVNVPDDLSAGLHGFSDTLTLTVESGDLGGTEQEFVEYFRSAIAEWFDTNRVFAKKQESI